MFNDLPLRRPSWLASPLTGLGPVAAVIFAVLSGPARAELTALGPLPYLSAADSPFASDSRYVTYIEDFEDGVLSIPGVVEVPLPPGIGLPPGPPPGGVDPIPGIVLPPGPNTDSVDGDDGAIDGSGSGGRSLESVRYSVFLTFPLTIRSALAFDFEPSASGEYPRAFGFVWTDGEPGSYVELFVGEVGVPVRKTVTFQKLVGDQAFDGGTAEDRFFGITSDAGITSIYIGSHYLDAVGDRGRNSFELDHVQVAYLVPEPSAAVLLMVGAAGFSLDRRRRSKSGLARRPKNRRIACGQSLLSHPRKRAL